MWKTVTQSDAVSSILSNPYALLVAGAILSFFFSSALEWSKRKRSPKKRLSWSVDIDSGIVDVSPAHQQKVRVFYQDREIRSLVGVRLRLVNTGNTTIKNQYLRFVLPREAKVMEFLSDPPPEPELDVHEVSDTSKPSERRFKIGHLEPGWAVEFRVIGDGGAWWDWRSGSAFHPYNADGDVVFERQGVARTKEDQEHVRSFVLYLLLFLLLPGLIGRILGERYWFVEPTVGLALMVLLVPHLAPFARLAQEFISNYLNGRPSTSLEARGGEGSIYQAAGSMYFAQKSDGSREAAN
jgi:hypothetical protein